MFYNILCCIRICFITYFIPSSGSLNNPSFYSLILFPHAIRGGQYGHLASIEEKRRNAHAVSEIELCPERANGKIIDFRHPQGEVVIFCYIMHL